MMKRKWANCKMHRHCADDNGFMLLEVMASVAILGLAVFAAIQLFAGALRLAGASDDYTEMVLLARERMVEALSARPLEEGSASGTTRDGMKWTVDVSGYKGRDAESASDAAFKICSVVVRVYEQGGRDYTLTTLKTVVQ